MIWIIGEYAERIDNADELLEQFLETFPEETSLVTMNLHTMAVIVHLLCAFHTCRSQPGTQRVCHVHMSLIAAQALILVSDAFKLQLLHT